MPERSHGALTDVRMRHVMGVCRYSPGSDSAAQDDDSEFESDGEAVTHELVAASSPNTSLWSGPPETEVIITSHRASEPGPSNEESAYTLFLQQYLQGKHSMQQGRAVSIVPVPSRFSSGGGTLSTHGGAVDSAADSDTDREGSGAVSDAGTHRAISEGQD